MQTPIKTNREEILKKLLESSKSREEIARECGIGIDTLRRLLNSDVSVHYRTAQKVRKYFGDTALNLH